MSVTDLYAAEEEKPWYKKEENQRKIAIIAVVGLVLAGYCCHQAQKPIPVKSYWF